MLSLPGAEVPRHFRSRERKSFAPGSESSRERKFHNSPPCSERLCLDVLQGRSEHSEGPENAPSAHFQINNINKFWERGHPSVCPTPNSGHLHGSTTAHVVLNVLWTAAVPCANSQWWHQDLRTGKPAAGPKAVR